ncbi:AAA family ATPase [Streptomyces marianii]|uniref:ATP-binding protein n=1 Tax=Streptomyces marianii TaxID=1817406 RepID=A0A5R9DYH8_9ACTN|nr:ATP-binding protein [Streptomyces marianii]TLQ42247.1 ATP-binding protein [Streptomyces marianii]
MGEAEPTPRRVFAGRLSELLGLAVDLPVKSAVAEANRRRPAGRGRPISGRRVSDWKQGRHLPESEVAFLVLVRVLLEHCRGRRIPADEVGAGLLDEEQWRRWLRAARASQPDAAPPARQGTAQGRPAEQPAPALGVSEAPTRSRDERPVHPRAVDRIGIGQGLSGEVSAGNGPRRTSGASVLPPDRGTRDLVVRACGRPAEREEFVGRAAELAALAERIEAAARGTGSVVLLAGPAGVGKSTLAAEALRRHTGSAGFTVVRGHCPRDAVAPPLWPWQRALRLAGVAPGVPAPRNAGSPPGAAGAATGQQSWGGDGAGHRGSGAVLGTGRDE